MVSNRFTTNGHTRGSESSECCRYYSIVCSSSTPQTGDYHVYRLGTVDSWNCMPSFWRIAARLDRSCTKYGGLQPIIVIFGLLYIYILFVCLYKHLSKLAVFDKINNHQTSSPSEQLLGLSLGHGPRANQVESIEPTWLAVSAPSPVALPGLVGQATRRRPLSDGYGPLV